MELRKHRKQFMILTKKLPFNKIPQYFSLKEIDNQVYLYYDRDLSIDRLYDSNGNLVYVIGIMIGDFKNVNDFHKNTGRFVTISKSILRLDATGSLGVFYTHSINPNLEDLICSSSQSLVSDVFDVELEGRDLAKSSLNWDISPLSRIKGMRRMFIDQVLNLETKEVKVEKRVISREYRHPQKAGELLAKQLQTFAAVLNERNVNVHLAMTAGSDSRMLFATLLAANVAFKAFTLDLGSGTKNDVKIAKLICNKYGIEHHTFKAKTLENPTAYDTFMKHSQGAGGDRAYLYAEGDYYRDIKPKSIVLHGGGFEIGQRFYENKFRNVYNSSKQPIPEKVLESFYIENDKESEDILKKWFEYRDANPIKNIDFVDLFYIDQRRAAWGSANRQAEDCFDFEWVIFSNSWLIYDTMLCVKTEERRKNSVQLMAMDYLIPDISKIYPINPSTFKTRIRRIVKSAVPNPLIAKLVKIIRK